MKRAILAAAIITAVLFIGCDSKESEKELLLYCGAGIRPPADELGMQIQAKALNAVIVWDAMARYYSKYGDAIPIALEKNVISTVDIGVLKFTKHRELAEKFVEFVVSEQGQAVFKKHNYSTEPPE